MTTRNALHRRTSNVLNLASGRLKAVRALGAGAAMTCLLLAGCAPGSGLPSLPSTPAGPYRLGVGEQVRIITFGEERLTGEFKVNDRGQIAVPLLGNIPANGLTTTELEHSIAQQLVDKKVLVNPSVSVEVLAYRPVFILGEVTKPGEYPYKPGMTVLTAVAIAGGFTYRAETDYASILRRVDSHPVEGKVSRNVEVRPGDVIDVYERYF
jgi:polysaccharide export outer membrane protein